MAKTSSTYVCQQCGFKSPQFLGRCPECSSWNSLVEQVEEGQKSRLRQGFGGQAKVGGAIINLSDVKKEYFDRIRTGIDEFDRVLGGGIVQGSVILIAGDPGIGKSTLLTQLALNINSERLRRTQKISKSVDQKQGNADIQTSSGKQSGSESFRGNVLYVSGEESAHQIKIRADRLNSKADFAILNEVDVDFITQVVESAKPNLVIVDSVQTIYTTDLESVAGSVGQVRECAHRLQRTAKNLHIPVFIVGHVTKEGTVAGPKTLEHLVDVVMNLEGDSQSRYRILRGVKNRFGSTNEVGIFEMDQNGMVEVKNPSKIFLESEGKRIKEPGSVVSTVLTGQRPILIEIQALVTKSNLAIPRRIAQGMDNNRLILLVALLSKRLGLPLFDQDIFVNITGGIKVDEPACDLGVCMAIVSSLKGEVVKSGSVFIGETGLLGELRNVRELERRITEAKKLGYKNIVSPVNVKSLGQAIKLGFGV